MTADKSQEKTKFRVLVKPQSFSDCFIATMDPKDPFKICLYPSVKSLTDTKNASFNIHYDEPENLILYNYLMLRRDLLLNP